MTSISRDQIKWTIIPQVCCRKGCKILTSSTRLRKTCDFHLAKSTAYRSNPELREKQKTYMANYYQKKRVQWSYYDWKKKKLETLLKLQEIPYVRIANVSKNFENISIKLENLKPPSTSNNSPSAFQPPQTPLDNLRTPKHSLCTLSDTP